MENPKSQSEKFNGWACLEAPSSKRLLIIKRRILFLRKVKSWFLKIYFATTYLHGRVTDDMNLD